MTASLVSKKVMATAARLIPCSRQTWAEAMIAEAEVLTGFAAIEFALGCLTTAFRLRTAEVLDRVPPHIRSGWVGGLLFTLTAMIPNSQSVPWICPIVTGILVAAGPPRFRTEDTVTRCTIAGFTAGVVVALTFFVLCTSIVLIGSWLVAGPALNERIEIILYGAAGALFLSPASVLLTRGAQHLVSSERNRS
jgi:hypothetical protein